MILGLLGITYGFVEAPQLGIDHPSIMFAIVFGILALVIFVWGEQRTKFSIMPLDLFKSRTFSGANLTNTLVYVSLGPSILYIPLYMIQVQGYSEIFVGLGIVPMTLLMLVISAFIGGMVDKYGPRKPIVAGSIVSGLRIFLTDNRRYHRWARDLLYHFLSADMPYWYRAGTYLGTGHHCGDGFGRTE